jgi:GNAT superfamily N-acetyltransferase
MGCDPVAGVDKDRNVSVRPRLGQDLEALVEVAARVREVDGYPAYLSDNDFHGFLTRPAALAPWVAEVDGEVVGHVALSPESHPEAMAIVRKAGITGEIGVVGRLLVDPAVRRQGLGAHLLEKARDAAVRQSRVPVLDVVVSAAPAISLYRESGWEELGRCKFEVPGDAPIEEVIFGAPE